MANVKFSDLTALTTLADADLLMVTDDSESSSEKSKKITFRTLVTSLLPPGIIMPYSAASAPTGWLHCNGQAVSRTTYADLYAVIGVVYGNGDASTTFNVPDYRGRFLRGWDNAAGNDPDAASRTNRGDSTTGDYVGTKQATANKSHNHTATASTDPGHTHSGVLVMSGATYDQQTLGYSNSSSGSTASGGSHGHTLTVAVDGGNESRPININVMYIIKY